jgi:DNA-binding IscR family transcriptional regulator
MGLNQKIFDYLDSVTLQQLVDSQIQPKTGSETAHIALRKKVP